MIRSCANFSDDQFWQLLQGDNKDHTYSANHLAECPHCQARLEHLAADAKHWSEIRDSLQPDREFDADASSSGENDTSRRPRSDTCGPSRWRGGCCHLPYTPRC